MYEQVAENKRNTILLVIGFSAFVLFLSWFIGIMIFGSSFVGLTLGLAFLVIFTLINYYFSDRIVLRLSGAKEVKKEDYPYLFNLIDGLAIAAGIPKPKAYVIDSPALNAFATGRDPEHGVVVVTTGIMKKLDRQELEGVIAHEIAHIKNYDIRLMTIIAVFVGLTALLSDILLWNSIIGGHRTEDSRLGIAFLIGGIILAILTPVVAMVIKMAISRQREFLADATGAMLTRNPEGLASALEKIGGDRNILQSANKATAHLYISNPLTNRHSFMDNMFSTHPPIAERVKKLRAM